MQLIDIDVLDGKGTITVAVASHVEAGRLRAFLRDRQKGLAPWLRVAAAAQALTDGARDAGDDFDVPSHLMAALALTLDELCSLKKQLAS